MRKRYVVIAAFLAVILITSTYFFLETNVFGSSKQTLTVYCATSLEFPLNKVDADFEAAYPNVNVEMQGHGSIQVIRQVTELNQKVDVMLVADYSLIPRMMYPTVDPQTNKSCADYYIRFAANTLVLAYTNSSKHASEINSSNWYSILALPDVKLGLVNPELDSIGYRTLMAIQLSQDYYGAKGLFLNLVTNNFDPPISSVPDGSNYTISVPDVQQPKSDKITLRASELDLIALLQSGYLDYCFFYVSNAKQYGFNYVELPNQVNLGDPAYASNYQRVQIVYSHQRFVTISLDRTGETNLLRVNNTFKCSSPTTGRAICPVPLEWAGKNRFCRSLPANFKSFIL